MTHADPRRPEPSAGPDEEGEAAMPLDTVDLPGPADGPNPTDRQPAPRP